MKWLERLSLIALSLVVSLSAACDHSSVPTSPGNITVRIAVTRNFGEELLFERSLELKANTNALDALKQVAAVETAYGDGFVNAINGTRTTFAGPFGDRQDWFFYVNGMASNTGALDYILHSGDIEQWDYHGWDFQQTTPATIGQFPEPFLHGQRNNIRPTVVTYTDNFEKEAVSLVQRLGGLGVKAAGMKKITELTETEKESSNLIIIGLPDAPVVSEINRQWRQLGLFARFDGKSLTVFNARGEVAGNYTSNTGIIMATQNPWNPGGTGAGENVAWLISGTDESGVRAAVDVLVNRMDELKYAYAAVVNGGKVTRLP